jgi:hypothetical protein
MAHALHDHGVAGHIRDDDGPVTRSQTVPSLSRRNTRAPREPDPPLPTSGLFA